MLRYNLEVTIENIEVDEKYFSFDYTVMLGAEILKGDSYSDDYCNGETPEEFRKTLENGWALNLVMQDLEGEF